MAMRFTSALYEDTQHELMPWRWLGDTAKRAGIRHDDQFKRAFEVAEAAGWLIVHDGNSVKLTFAGIRAVRRFLDSAEDVQLDVPALPAQPFLSIGQHATCNGNLVSTNLTRMPAFALGQGHPVEDELVDQARNGGDRALLFTRVC